MRTWTCAAAAGSLACATLAVAPVATAQSATAQPATAQSATARPVTAASPAKLNVCVAAVNDKAGRYFGFSIKPVGSQFSAVLGTVQAGHDNKVGCMAKPVALPSGPYNVILEASLTNAKRDSRVTKYAVKGPTGKAKTVVAPKKQPSKFAVKVTVADSKTTTVTFYNAMSTPYSP